MNPSSETATVSPPAGPREGFQVDTRMLGLSTAEARRRFESQGANEIPEGKTRSGWRILFEIVREPMFLLLLGCGGVYVLLGEPGEAGILLGFVGVIIGITLYQQAKTEKALTALRDLSSPRALVIRDGQPVRIAGREVVTGDLLVLAEGDRVSADAALIEVTHMSVDESLLTGESVPVRKLAWVAGHAPSPPGGDDLPFLFSGTLVVSGRGLARVMATGSQTELGRIGVALGQIEQPQTYLQRETGRVVKCLALTGMSLCIVVAVSYGLIRHDWMNGLLSGLTLAMSILPEEFPVVLTIFLALGAYRLSRVKVLTRRALTVETLGAATVLCTDKTGTLTQNRMRLAALATRGDILRLKTLDRGIPESHHALIEYAILASQLDPFDPMEQEIRSMGLRFAADHIHNEWRLVREYPLSKELLSMSCVWESPDAQHLIVAAKGAPEAIMDLCHLPESVRRCIGQDIGTLAGQGMRLLGVARATSAQLHGIQHDFDFEYLGLVGFTDPIRSDASAAIAECMAAGIRPIMITGDYPVTARHIGDEVGLPKGRLLTGPELGAINDTGLDAIIDEVSIFARAVPEQKLRIVQALQFRGEVVAMTGDGVNDAPALKVSDIGIAMGLRGTDVARETADLVLLDDAFSSIVAGIRMGRRIFDNVRKAMAYVIAIHIPVAGLSLLPLVLEAATSKPWPLLLMPVHIVFLELIIDPACSVVFEMEPAEADVMKRRPRDVRERLFTPRMVVLSVLQGVSVLVAASLVYAYGHDHSFADGRIRAAVFSTLVFANLGLVMVNRSWSDSVFGLCVIRNEALWWMVPGAIGMLAAVITVPWFQHLFHFEGLSPTDLAIALAAACASLIWFEVYKAFRRGRARKHPAVLLTKSASSVATGRTPVTKPPPRPGRRKLRGKRHRK